MELDNNSNVSKKKKNSMFIPQISIRNLSTTRNLKIIIDLYLKQNQIEYANYTINQLSPIDFSILLDDEDLALKLTENLCSIIKESYTQVYFELMPTQHTLKKAKKDTLTTIKKETIEKLYLGLYPSLGKKKEKKKNGYYFQEFNDNKRKKNLSDILLKEVDKDKWSNPTNFHVFTNSKSSVMKVSSKEYVPDPYMPPAGINFREINKNKWVSPTNFSL